jgi:hypothetical protein
MTFTDHIVEWFVQLHSLGSSKNNRLTQPIGSIDVKEKPSKAEAVRDCPFEIDNERLVYVLAVYCCQIELGAKSLRTQQPRLAEGRKR